MKSLLKLTLFVFIAYAISVNAAKLSTNVVGQGGWYPYAKYLAWHKTWIKRKDAAVIWRKNLICYQLKDMKSAYNSFIVQNYTYSDRCHLLDSFGQVAIEKKYYGDRIFQVWIWYPYTYNEETNKIYAERAYVFSQRLTFKIFLEKQLIK